MKTTALPPAPAALPTPSSTDRLLGRYLGRITDVDTAAWDAEGFPSRRRRQRKAWLYLGGYSERCHIGFAIVDAGYLATAFVYVHDRQTGRFIERKAARPLAFGNWNPSLDTEWSLSSRGERWRIVPDGKGWRASFRGKGLDVELSVPETQEGLSVIAPARDRPFHYTYKNTAGAGAYRFGTASGEISGDTATIIDFSKGYPPRNMFWNWASLVGTTDRGEQLGVNLVGDFNNGIENALWLDGRLVPLGQAVFAYPLGAYEAPWRITTADGVVDLDFHFEGVRSENLNVGVLASRFAQPYGRFSGTLRLADGERSIEAFGVTEEHFAVW